MMRRPRGGCYAGGGPAAATPLHHSISTVRRGARLWCRTAAESMESRSGKPPSVLVVMSDQQKATASHLYGSQFGRTPSMERLMQRGVLYEVACTPHPLCVPARCAFWCSQYAHTTGCRRNETLLPPGAPHAMRLWSERGFRLGLIGKNHCFQEPEDLALFDVLQELGHGGASGTDWGRPPEAIAAAARQRRDLKPRNPRFGCGTSDLPLEDQTTGLVTDQSIRFLEEHATEHPDQPFVLWTSYPDPHEPWVCPEQYAAMFRETVQLPPWKEGEFDAGSGAPERNRVLHRMLGIENDDEADVMELLACYYGMMRCVDDGLGRLLDALERLGLEEEVIVVYTSDHGDFVGEHMQQCKGGVFYDCLTRVPLIISWPGHPQQPAAGWRETTSICSTIDVRTDVCISGGAS
jgi:arylsulfatase